MTNPPTGGSASTSTSEAPSATVAGAPSAPPVSGAAKSSDAGDFGATTLSGSTTPPGTVGGPGAPGPGAAGPGAAGPGAPGPGPSGPAGEPLTPTSSGIRGIRTGRNRGPRRARLQIRHINPVTVLKFSCVLAVALFFVWLIVIGVLFGVLDSAGVIGHINDTITQLRGSDAKPPVTAGIVFGGAAIVGVVYIVLFIALSTIGAVIYNLCADLVGGIEVTLSER